MLDLSADTGTQFEWLCKRRPDSFAQIQIVQTNLTSIEVRYIPLDRNESIDRDGLETCLRELIDPSFNVQAVAVDEIPRSPSGKFEDYLSLVARPQN
jgi:hypothetical protein